MLAIAAMQSMVVACVGPRIMMLQFREGPKAEDGGSGSNTAQLVEVGFLMVGFMISSISTLNHYAMVADAYDGVFFIVWKHIKKAFVILGKAPAAAVDASAGALACSLLLEQPTLHLVVADEHARLRVFAFNKSATESKGGSILLPRATFHAGCPISKLLPLHMPRAFAGATGVRGGALRCALLFGAVDGTVGFVSPLDEGLFRRASFLGTRMPTGAPQPAGLHPKAFRAHHARPVAARELKGVVDGALLRQYALLDAAAQEKLALQIGATRSALLDDLRALDDIGRRVLSLLT